MGVIAFTSFSIGFLLHPCQIGEALCGSSQPGNLRRSCPWQKFASSPLSPGFRHDDAVREGGGLVAQDDLLGARKDVAEAGDQTRESRKEGTCIQERQKRRKDSESNPSCLELYAPRWLNTFSFPAAGFSGDMQASLLPDTHSCVTDLAASHAHIIDADRPLRAFFLCDQSTRKVGMVSA